MFPFTPHTTPRLDFGLGGFLFYRFKNDLGKPTGLGLGCIEALLRVDVPHRPDGGRKPQ
ncbi:hypothetical protein [Synechococcus sp. PCC 6312]|uniref:hypothetical protein n=1 Tax=Synechococcus sp. (strain ATCC 27167 / PCC 6312) TaxID=195253 RepID=UPI0012EA82DA|nr:hypothetical protein [Synechococcus sp. PCC 6312]